MITKDILLSILCIMYCIFTLDMVPILVIFKTLFSLISTKTSGYTSRQSKLEDERKCAIIILLHLFLFIR